MPGKMDNDRLRPDLRGRETNALILALLDLMANRVHVVEQYRRAGAKGMTFLDHVLAIHIFAFRAHGTRQQHLVDYLDASRWTIRDSLDRLERNKIIVRREGLYFPAAPMADMANAEADDTLAKIARLCEAFNARRESR